jgi:signal transduction histidine kinase
VAHEINNPVSGVLNLSMLLQRMLKEDGVPHDRIPDFRRYLGQVTSETARVGRIVSDLLAFSRRGKPQRAPADLNRIVRTTLSLVEHKMKLNNVAVQAIYCEDLPPAPCDSSQIQQVVLNLMLNAAEATHSKPERFVTVTTSKGDGVVLMQVSDNGEGIPPENLAKIFDPFFTTKPEGKGVGLGLAVSYGIVDSHGGELEVKSTVGVGTTFTMSLPLVEPQAREEAAPALAARRE